MPREDSRPTEDNARSGLKNGVPAFPDRVAWGLDTRKSPTAQDRSACLRLFETTSRRPVSPRAASHGGPLPGSDSREGARRGGWLGRREGADRSVAQIHVRIRARPRTTPEVV